MIKARLASGAVRRLLPLAERWGIGDDYERERLIDEAGRSDLERLVSAIDAAPESM